MEKTGLTDNIYALISKYDINRQIKDKSDVIIDENTIFNEFKNVLYKINSTRDIATILEAERGMLNYELSNCSDSPLDKGRVTGLTSAIDDLNKAASMLELVKHTEQYRLQDKIMSQHKIDRRDGIPRDAFHRFIDSHKTRLGNKLIFSEGSAQERLYTKERYNSMVIAKQEYIKLQAKALDITLSEKSREIER